MNKENIKEETYKDIISGRKVKCGNPINKKDWDKYEVEEWFTNFEE